MSEKIEREFWGNKFVKWVVVDAMGLTGGILFVGQLACGSF